MYNTCFLFNLFCRKHQVSDCTNIYIYLCFNGVKYSKEESISFFKHTHKLYVRTLLTASATQGCGTEAKFSLLRHTFEAASRKNLLIPEPTSTSSTQSSKNVSFGDSGMPVKIRFQEALLLTLQKVYKGPN